MMELENKTDLPAPDVGQLIIVTIGKISPEQKHLASTGPVKSSHDVQQGAFSGS
jgi:hypothetical protein